MTEKKGPGRSPLDQSALEKANEFMVVFADGKGLDCRLLAIDIYNLLVISGDRKLLIPKHSIRYVVLSPKPTPNAKQGTGSVTPPPGP